MYSIIELTNILEIRLSKKRFTHSINVACEAKKLAEYYLCDDPDRAYIAGLLHDICKEIPQDEQRSMAEKGGRGICEIELSTPPLYHAPAGAYYISSTLGIHNDDLLNAVRFHTVGRKNMSSLEEVIYLADLISADRTYKDVGKMRKLAYQNINKAMFEALRFTVMDISAKRSQFPCHTVDAYNYYVNKRK